MVMTNWRVLFAMLATIPTLAASAEAQTGAEPTANRTVTPIDWRKECPLSGFLVVMREFDPAVHVDAASRTASARPGLVLTFRGRDPVDEATTKQEAGKPPPQPLCLVERRRLRPNATVETLRVRPGEVPLGPNVSAKLAEMQPGDEQRYRSITEFTDESVQKVLKDWGFSTQDQIRLLDQLGVRPFGSFDDNGWNTLSITQYILRRLQDQPIELNSTVYQTAHYTVCEQSILTGKTTFREIWMEIRTGLPVLETKMPATASCAQINAPSSDAIGMARVATIEPLQVTSTGSPQRSPAARSARR
jgi:hypothetical protein